MRWVVVDETAKGANAERSSEVIGNRKQNCKNSTVVRQLNNELGRPSSAPHTLNGKDRSKKRIRRRKLIEGIIRSPPWKRSTNIQDIADKEPYISNIHRKQQQVAATAASTAKQTCGRINIFRETRATVTYT